MPLLPQLREQHVYTLDMYDAVLERVTAEIWGQTFGANTFWREAYHTLFWAKVLLQGPNGRFDPTPYGKDIDPRLSTPPNNSCSIDEMKTFSADYRKHIATVFSDLTEADLDLSNTLDDMTTVLHRILYGFRHTQHHTGKLTGYLCCSGIQFAHWAG